ncbi:MAG: DUF507 family protein [Deltaproteobacteria bacterium]|nr:DUF507 family protein [Deltaproteobacteria bacterium]
MRITLEQVEKISKRVLEDLSKKKLIIVKASEEDIVRKIQDVFLADLHAEEKLDKEVDEIINSHSSEIEEERIDYRKMFNMIKGKLVRERGLII